ncbi:ArsR/SmtB family transcription factor [Kingella negevensis]|uniref:HTH-type transcriptional repressor SmtB n=1 Tax=Kingella negevensis TaxID=1522312 RepID=A0A238HE40_9NEIS|nr:helix-turn-helix domain-containing protein [Kingella negevensis]MDK4681014.1 helix-turn-helix domain-containing protein [Kingella negevensis]MDK4683216.1 helix-turn-helix domain-containing protein [Kingella negevensis]MDK4683888.1 helix-turn-helix domain-containing protein [Kingella negevensis]MDK4688074.1 helix-turn-helix domain-containing protein [Kingella negevensis]MDK4691652.1 helix-turn-helix domain-containing protein [Kingella negevensis]
MLKTAPILQPTPTLNETAQLFKALSNPQRLAILLDLNDDVRSLKELAESTGQPPTQLATHLEKLRQMGIVDHTRFMRILQYRIISPTVLSVLKTLQPENKIVA